MTNMKMAGESPGRIAEGVSVDTLEAYFAEALPLFGLFGMRLTALSPGRVDLSLRAAERLVRPGGGIAGPILFAMADVGIYAAVFTLRGITPMAVTSDLGMHFLRPARTTELRCTAELVKAGRRLAYAEARIYDDVGQQVARASGSYALPERTA